MEKNCTSPGSVGQEYEKVFLVCLNVASFFCANPGKETYRDFATNQDAKLTSYNGEGGRERNAVC